MAAISIRSGRLVSFALFLGLVISPLAWSDTSVEAKPEATPAEPAKTEAGTPANPEQAIPQIQQRIREWVKTVGEEPKSMGKSARDVEQKFGVPEGTFNDDLQPDFARIAKMNKLDQANAFALIDEFYSNKDYMDKRIAYQGADGKMKEACLFCESGLYKPEYAELKKAVESGSLYEARTPVQGGANSGSSIASKAGGGCPSGQCGQKGGDTPANERGNQGFGGPGATDPNMALALAANPRGQQLGAAAGAGAAAGGSKGGDAGGTDGGGSDGTSGSGTKSMSGDTSWAALKGKKAGPIEIFSLSSGGKEESAPSTDAEPSFVGFTPQPFDYSSNLAPATEAPVAARQVASVAPVPTGGETANGPQAAVEESESLVADAQNTLGEPSEGTAFHGLSASDLDTSDLDSGE